MTFTNEQIAQAKKVKSVEELISFAKENGIGLTEEEAKKYFADLHKNGELADDELDNVAGGSQCKSGKTYSSDPPYKLIVTVGNSCTMYTPGNGDNGNCYTCQHVSHDGIVYYCDVRTLNNDPLR